MSRFRITSTDQWMIVGIRLTIASRHQIQHRFFFQQTSVSPNTKGFSLWHHGLGGVQCRIHKHDVAARNKQTKQDSDRAKWKSGGYGRQLQNIGANVNQLDESITTSACILQSIYMHKSGNKFQAILCSVLCRGNKPKGIPTLRGISEVLVVKIGMNETHITNVVYIAKPVKES